MLATVRQRLSQPGVALRVSIVAATASVALFAFALTFHGLDGAGQIVLRLPRWLAPLAPLTVDGLTLVAIACTYAMRDAKLRQRAYAWLVFGGAVAASTLGNLAYARALGLSSDGKWGAALPPVALAAATHLAIKAFKHLDSQRESDDEGDSPDDTTSDTDCNSDSRSDIVSLVVSHDDNDSDNRSDIERQARIAVSLGASCRVAASRLGVSQRQVERWTTDIRNNQKAE